MAAALLRSLKRLLRGPPPPLSAAQVDLLDRVPALARLSPERRALLHARVARLLDEVRFEGCGGLELTDEIRLAIAGQACLLLLGRPDDDYDELETVLVYPSGWKSQQRREHAGGFLEARVEARQGESWGHGLVVIAWDAARRGAVDPDDGHNVVLHEFAHQLDTDDGPADGAPSLDGGWAVWARTFAAHYARHQDAAARGAPTLLDPYGATAPAEFFAVATECFFERPEALRRRHPELYAELARFYGEPEP